MLSLPLCTASRHQESGYAGEGAASCQRQLTSASAPTSGWKKRSTSPRPPTENAPRATRGTRKTPKVNSDVMTAPSVIVIASTIAKKGPATKARQERTQHLKDPTVCCGFSHDWDSHAAGMQQVLHAPRLCLPGTQRQPANIAVTTPSPIRAAPPGNTFSARGACSTSTFGETSTPQSLHCAMRARAACRQ